MSDDKSRLEVTNKAGVKFESPQQLLNGFLGSLSFDPLAFANMKADEQKEILLDIVKPPIDLKKLERDFHELYSERTAIGRQRDQAKAVADETNIDFTGVPDQEIDLTQHSRDLEKKLKENAAIDKVNGEILQLKAIIEKVKKELADAEADLIVAESHRASLQKEKHDVSVVQSELSQSEVMNRRVRAKAKHISEIQAFAKLKNQYDTMTNDLKAMTEQKSTALGSVKMPIEGLGVTSEGVTFNNIPFSQLSGAEKLKVSLAIAMAINPDIRVIRITDGSLLDSDNIKIVEEMAKEKGYQVWLERVEDTNSMAVHIEDGEVSV